MTTVASLNRKITIKSWTHDQDLGGGVGAVQVLSYPIWAKVEARNGTPFINEEQQVWNYDYKVIFRYENSRLVRSNFTIDYDSKRLKINSLSFEEEGNRRFCVCRCTTMDASVDTANDTIITTLLGQLVYYGIGGETSFLANGSPMGGTSVTGVQTVATDIRNKTVFRADKDGVRYDVILSGTPSALNKEVKYIPSTGEFIWSIPFEPHEVGQIDYF